MKGLINIQNEDNECCSSCLVRYLNPVNKNPEKFRNADRDFVKQLSFKEAKFPVHKTDFTKIKKQSNISIDVFGYEDERPYQIYTSKQTFEKHVALLLLSNSKNSPYVLIKGFNRFMIIQQNNTVQSIFDDIGLQWFSSL